MQIGQKVSYREYASDHRGISTSRIITREGTYQGDTQDGRYAVIASNQWPHGKSWVEHDRLTKTN